LSYVRIYAEIADTLYESAGVKPRIRVRESRGDEIDKGEGSSPKGIEGW